MYKNCKIFYFSGTGNTKIVAELHKAEFEATGTMVEITNLNGLNEGKVNIETDGFDLIGIGYPVHALDAPQIMYDLVEKLSKGEGKRTFIFKTAGDFLRINTDSSSNLIKQLNKKGYDVFNDNLIVMPANVLFRYKPEFEKQLYNTAAYVVKRHTQEILGGVYNLKKAGTLSKMLSWFGKAEKQGAAKLGERMKTTKECTLCNKCVNNCPNGNIYREGDKIKFGRNCLLCMRCMYECPNNAIDLGKGNFFKLKNGYNLKEIIDDPDIKGIYVTKRTWGYFRHFYKYFYHD